MVSRFVGGVGLALLLCGCAATPPLAVVTYSHADCAREPDLSTAVSLTPEKPTSEFAVTTRLTPQTGCLAQSGVASPYVLYALPAAPEGKTITVGAVLEAKRLLAPRVAILDGRGRVTRDFAASDFMFRGPIYSVQFRPRTGEAYVLVSADPDKIGKSFSEIEIGTQTVAVSTGYATARWTSGIDKSVARTFSYEGVFRAIVFDSRAKGQR